MKCDYKLLLKVCFYIFSDTDVFLSGSRMSLYDRTDDEKKEIMDESKILPMHK